jgi:hypothetical protein
MKKLVNEGPCDVCGQPSDVGYPSALWDLEGIPMAPELITLCPKHHRAGKHAVREGLLLRLIEWYQKKESKAV